MIHIAYADHDSIVRRSIAGFICSNGRFSVDIQADNGQDLLTQIRIAPALPDICLLDINMPVKNGYQTINEIKAQWPTIKILVLTGIDKEYTIRQVVRSGANGYLLKSCEPDDLNSALISIYNTGYYVTELTSKHIFSFLESGDNPMPNITGKELNFLSLCCSDYSYNEIADILHVSPRTIHGYRDVLFEKLCIKSRTGLALFALSIGLSSPRQ